MLQDQYRTTRLSSLYSTLRPTSKIKAKHGTFTMKMQVPSAAMCVVDRSRRYSQPTTGQHDRMRRRRQASRSIELVPIGMLDSVIGSPLRDAH